MEDRFIGYRGSQENEWSWEPDQSTSPAGDGTRGARNVVFAVLSAFALVTVVLAAVYFIASAGDDNGGPIVSVTATPTRRPTASPTERPTAIPTTPALTATPAPSPSPSPSPVPGTPRPNIEFLLWNEKAARWQEEDLKKDASGVAEGDVVLFLYKLSGLKAGETYEVDIDYFDCGLSPGQSFDHLASTGSSGDAPQLAAPGPGRVRPDSQVPVPDDPAIANDGEPTAYLSLWGATFQHSPTLTATPANCAGDKKLTVRVLAQASTLYLEWGGHLASAADWLGEGASSAKSAFGMTATLQGADEARLEVLAGAVSKSYALRFRRR